MFVSKYLLSEDTVFDFALLNYTQIDEDKVGVGCGNLEYIPKFWTKPDPLAKLIP